MTPSPQSPLARLAPEVLEFTGPSFVLQEDLHRLEAVHRAGAVEAVVFYCARILDALAGEALRRVGQAPTTNVFSNLQVLEHLGRVSTATRYWAHALRRLGNAVRHLAGRVGPEEAVLSTVFAEGCLDWFFCRFSHGCQLPALTRDQSPLGLGADPRLRALMRFLEELDATGPSPPTGPGQADLENDPRFLATPVLAAVLAEIRLSRQEHEAAYRVLEAALSRFPDDVRLHQLMGLYWGRAGQPQRGLQWLEPLYARFHDDDETAGITAGLYKRKWQADREHRDALEQSHRVYREAWKSSGRKSAYLGINSATTALWLGRADEARRLAREVEELLRRRAAGLPRDLSDPRLAFQFWDQLTLAEALLVQGDWPAAEKLYREVFAQHSERSGDIAVSRQQMGEILKALGLPCTLG
jgi:tetratricopeptide (TPR) repeat protein